MNYETYNIIGFLGATFSTIAYFPQLYTVIERKSAKDLSYIALINTTIATGLWFSYGIAINSLQLIICDGIIIIFNLFLIFFKWYYMKYNYVEKQIQTISFIE